MRKSLDAKLEALSEVSSSQSGNSTPSSSLSCIPSATPKCNWPMSPDEEQPLEGPSSMTQVATQHSANDQAFATVVVSNILKPASTQRFTKIQTNFTSIPGKGIYVSHLKLRYCVVQRSKAGVTSFSKANAFELFCKM
ncbi:hypothetical protein JHK87_001610 [Glycine soja]|nr:hypothetical protein JHK87_001610 [Glycine soja]